jgi:hypothetical protein
LRGFEPALPSNQPTSRRDHDRVQQTHVLNTFDEGPQITQVLPVAEADLNVVNVHLH